MASWCHRRLLCLLLLLLSASAISTQVSGEAKFLLSCRVISGICQGDGRCLDEMSARFPDCYLESPFDLGPAKPSELLLAAPVPADEQHEGQQQQLDKRAPAVKLMRVLMMKDRIPVGRRR